MTQPTAHRRRDIRELSGHENRHKLYCSRVRVIMSENVYQPVQDPWVVWPASTSTPNFPLSFFYYLRHSARDSSIMLRLRRIIISNIMNSVSLGWHIEVLFISLTQSYASVAMCWRRVGNRPGPSTGQVLFGILCRSGQLGSGNLWFVLYYYSRNLVDYFDGLSTLRYVFRH